VKASDAASSLVLFGSGVLVCVGSAQLSLGSLRHPGPGLYPLILGIILGLLAILLGAAAIFRSDQVQKEPSTNFHTGQVWGIVATLLVYALVLPEAGYTLATFFMLGLLFKLGGIRTWWFAGLLAVLFTIGTELLAGVFGIRLPHGLV
jgi:putative tricarboxylic transport membrane protein